MEQPKQEWFLTVGHEVSQLFKSEHVRATGNRVIQPEVAVRIVEDDEISHRYGRPAFAHMVKPKDFSAIGDVLKQFSAVYQVALTVALHHTPVAA